MNKEHLKAIYALCEKADLSDDFSTGVQDMDLHRVKRTLVTAGKYIREHGLKDEDSIYKFNLSHYLEKGTCLSDGMAVRIGMYMPVRDIPLHINSSDAIIRIILRYRLKIGE